MSCIIMECPSSSLPMNSMLAKTCSSTVHINQCVKKALIVLETHHMCDVHDGLYVYRFI